MAELSLYRFIEWDLKVSGYSDSAVAKAVNKAIKVLTIATSATLSGPVLGDLIQTRAGCHNGRRVRLALEPRLHSSPAYTCPKIVKMAA